MPESRRVLVTGAASGLGLAFTRLLVSRGDLVLATDRAETRPAQLPAAAAYLQLDVREADAWERAMLDVRARWGGLDLLINNAGVAAGSRFDLMSDKEWEWIVSINLLGVVKGVRAALPLLRESRGQIVNVASVAGLIHGPSMASYNATKAAVVAVSETLSHELYRDGIRVSCVCPGFFRSNLGASLPGTDPAAEKTARALIGRSPRSADDIARRAMKGIDAGREVILTEAFGRALVGLKRVARPIYRRGMRAVAARR